MARRKSSAKKKQPPTTMKVTPEPPQSSSSSSSQNEIETTITTNAEPPIVETMKIEKKEKATKKITTRAASVAKHQKETTTTTAPGTTRSIKTKQVSKTVSSKSNVTNPVQKVKKDESSSSDSGSDSDSESESSSSSSSDEEMPQAPAKDDDDDESEDSSSSDDDDEDDDDKKKVAQKKKKVGNKNDKLSLSKKDSSIQPRKNVLDKTVSENSNDESGSDESESGSESDNDGESSDDDSDAMEVDDDNKAKLDKNSGFTDENAKWLKPKKKQELLSSSDDDDDDDDKSPSDESDTELLEVERQSRILDETLAQEAAEAEAELQHTIATQTSIYHLPTPDELADETSDTRVTPPSELRQRITDILHVLSSFTTRREPHRSRAEYISVLSSTMANLFGYLPELVDMFLTLFSPVETMTFLEANETHRPLVIRTNTLKTRRKDLAHALMKRGVTLDPLANWSKVGLKITASPVPIGATPEYLAGYYMLQSAASLCPVMALDPQVTDKVLDMSAAPGGKTSFICQLMKNHGVVVANDLKEERQVATAANLQRLGCRNVVVRVGDGRKVTGAFDRVLLDAPCSGLGVIARDASVKVRRTVKDVERCAVLQKELLLKAIDCCRYKKVGGKGKKGSKEKVGGGGVIVYSTCSISVQENEEVVDYVLKKRNVKLVDADLPFGKPGFTRYQNKRFNPSLALSRRFYPHVHNMDGFFVAKFQKLGDGPRLSKEEELEKIKQKEEIKEKLTNDAQVSTNTSTMTTTTSTKGKKNKKRDRKDDDDDDDDTNLTDDDASLDDNIKRLLKEGTISSSTATATKNINADNDETVSNRKGGRHKTTTRGKKRPSDNDYDNEQQQQPSLTKTKGKRTKVLSVPPVRKTKKPSTNAKVTKPRRKKMVEDDGV